MENNNTIKNKTLKFTPAKTIILGFVGIILIGTALLCLPISHQNRQWFSFVDSLFTSTSAVCVTGLTVIDVAKNFSLFGQIIVLLLIQVGGLGFVSITCLMFMILGKKINYSTRMSLQESLNKDNAQGVVKMVRKIIITIFCIEFVGFLILAPSLIQFTGNFWSGCFKALFLSVSAFCNAGFDPLGSTTAEFSNLMHFANNPFVLIPIMLLVILGGIGFVVLFDIFNFKKENKKLQLHTKIVLAMTTILILGGTILFAIFEWNNPNTIGNMTVFDKITNSFFQAITPRTAGFATIDQSCLTSTSLFITQMLMIIGGSPMGIAGGIKTTTIFILLLFLFKKPLDDGSINYKYNNISKKLINKAIKLLLAITTLIILGSMLIAVFEINKGVTFGAITFECISAISTVGLSLNLTPLLSVASKFVLITLMFVGRVGMLTVPLIFKSNNNIENEIKYADSKIIVG
ncbi:MAG: Trk family potassium uptake protein [Clostridia bacterium]|nr:Trk family potassium uptake protein [Clostridia bacterium]